MALLPTLMIANQKVVVSIFYRTTIVTISILRDVTKLTTVVLGTRDPFALLSQHHHQLQHQHLASITVTVYHGRIAPFLLVMIVILKGYAFLQMPMAFVLDWNREQNTPVLCLRLQRQPLHQCHQHLLVSIQAL